MFVLITKFHNFFFNNQKEPDENNKQNNIDNQHDNNDDDANHKNTTTTTTKTTTTTTTTTNDITTSNEPDENNKQNDIDNQHDNENVENIDDANNKNTITNDITPKLIGMDNNDADNNSDDDMINSNDINNDTIDVVEDEDDGDDDDDLFGDTNSVRVSTSTTADKFVTKHIMISCSFKHIEGMNKIVLLNHEPSKTIPLIVYIATIPIIYNYKTIESVGFGTYGSKIKDPTWRINIKENNLVHITSMKINHRTIQNYRVSLNSRFYKKQLHAITGRLNITHLNKNIFSNLSFSIIYNFEIDGNDHSVKNILTQVINNNINSKKRGTTINFLHDDYEYIDYMDKKKSSDKYYDYGKNLTENFSINQKSYQYKYIFQNQYFNYNFNNTDPTVRLMAKYLQRWIKHLHQYNCIKHYEYTNYTDLLEIVKYSTDEIIFEMISNKGSICVMDIFHDIYINTLQSIIDAAFSNFSIDKILYLQLSFIESSLDNNYKKTDNKEETNNNNHYQKNIASKYLMYVKSLLPTYDEKKEIFGKLIKERNIYNCVNNHQHNNNSNSSLTDNEIKSLNLNEKYYDVFCLYNSAFQTNMDSRKSILEIYQFNSTELFTFGNSQIDGQHFIRKNILNLLSNSIELNVNQSRYNSKELILSSKDNNNFNDAINGEHINYERIQPIYEIIDYYNNKLSNETKILKVYTAESYRIQQEHVKNTEECQTLKICILLLSHVIEKYNNMFDFYNNICFTPFPTKQEKESKRPYHRNIPTYANSGVEHYKHGTMDNVNLNNLLNGVKSILYMKTIISVLDAIFQHEFSEEERNQIVNHDRKLLSHYDKLKKSLIECHPFALSQKIPLFRVKTSDSPNRNTTSTLKEIIYMNHFYDIYTIKQPVDDIEK